MIRGCCAGITILVRGRLPIGQICYGAMISLLWCRLLLQPRRCFLQSSSFLDDDEGNGCGDGLLIFTGEKLLNFAGKRHFLVVSYMCVLIVGTTVRINSGDAGVRLLNACMNDVDYVHRSMLQSNTLFKLLFQTYRRVKFC